MVGISRREKEDGDYRRAVFRSTVGGRKEPAGAGMFMELLRSLDKWDIP